MNIAILYHDKSKNPAILSMLNSILKMLEQVNRNYTLFTDVSEFNQDANYDLVFVVVLLPDEMIRQFLETTQSENMKVVSIATNAINQTLNSSIHIDIDPGFMIYVKNGTLLYTLNKVISDVENNVSKTVYKPVLRKDIIQNTLKKLNAKTYLEIGVSNGENFLQIEAPFIIGVDPISPNQQIKSSLSDTRLYFQQMSDDFFHNNQELLAERRIDLAFIDGAHNYQQSLRDLNNCLKYLNPGGMIIMHDCNPISAIVETPAPTYEDACEIVKNKNISPYGFAWTGDVWKTIVYIRSTFSDLDVKTLDCDFGLGIIQKNGQVNQLNYNSEQIDKLNYDFLEKNRKVLLNLSEPEMVFN